MKKFYFTSHVLLLSMAFLSFVATAQAPQKMSYQSVLRNSSNALLANTAVGIKISVLQGNASGAAVYVETQTATTNANGLVSLQIGTGTATAGTFAEINWANGPYFIKTETDPAGGSIYTVIGTQEMMSVPYAMYAAKSGGTVFEPTFDMPDAIHNTNAGNVGIGTDLPSAKLDIAGDIRIRGGNPAQGKVLISNDFGVATWEMPAPSVFEPTIDMPDAIHNTNSGNVGIGTDLPSEKLDVSGNLKVRQNATVSGTATASSFVKDGGTSSQFLLADGSVSDGILAAITTMSNQITSLQGQVSGLQYQVYTLTMPTVIIGAQTWTSTNLNVTTYRDGTPIPEIQDPTAWASLTTGAWCHLNNNPANDAIYGKMYNHYAVEDPRGLAPTGYHIPTQLEWLALFNTAGGSYSCSPKLRSAAFNGTNNYGFSVLNGGFRSGNAQISSFGGPGIPAGTFETDAAIFWSSDILPQNTGALFGDFNATITSNFPNNYGAYIRLIKN